MTDNKLWDTIINPNADISLTLTSTGLLRGIRLSYKHKDKLIVINESSFDDIGTNYKRARQSMIKEVRCLGI